MKPTSLLDNVPSVVDSVDSQNTNIEEPITIHSNYNQLIHNIETGTSCNTDLKMSDIKELEQLKTKYAELQNEVDYLNLS